jgi:hypothetical protein
VKGEFGEDDVGAVAADGFGFGGQSDDAGTIGPFDFGARIAMQTGAGGDGVAVDFEFEVLGPFPGFFEGFDGLAFARGDNEPSGFGIFEAIENGFGSTGEVLAGLACPEADFEATRVRGKSGLVREKLHIYCGLRISDCGIHRSRVVGVFVFCFLRLRGPPETVETVAGPDGGSTPD